MATTRFNLSRLTFIIKLKHDNYNKNYFCDLWDDFYYPPLKMNNKIQSSIYREFTLDSNMFLNTTIYHILDSLGVVSLTQLTRHHPCRDTISITKFGDTIPMPEIWRTFKAKLNNGNALSIVAILMTFYANNLIEYAELNSILELDASPNDPTYGDTYGSQGIVQRNLMNELVGQDIETAWDYTTGERDIKVAVIDLGFDWSHQDFGNGIGPTYRIIDGIKYPSYQSPPAPDPTPGGRHGTRAAGMIGANSHNNLDVASIAGGWNSVSDGVSLVILPIESLASNEAAAFMDAASNSPSYPYSMDCDVISMSMSLKNSFSKSIREALSFAHVQGLSVFTSKGNQSSKKFVAPTDYDYNQICAVGAYKPIIRASPPFDYVVTKKDDSNYGFGLNVLAHGENKLDGSGHPYMINQTLEAGGGTSWFSQTSAATPQVAALGALVQSEFISNSNLDFKIKPSN